LFPPLSNNPKDKEKKRRALSQRAFEDFDSWKMRSRLS
jgi:methylenetetrahydrofolate--tRNA-(uracil-5-)-methyltransferase